MIFALALLPALFLLIFIYIKDKKEKESFKLLLKCFFMGVLSIIPSLILEFLLEDVLLVDVVQAGSISSAFISGFIVAGMTEELFKYLMLKKVTWKRDEFNYMFDGIVYAVFVSLGFAAIENLFYVMDGGTSTAIMRMFTAIPGHTIFGVYMGYYYSHAKKAEIEGVTKAYKRYQLRALLVPMMIHGLYDALLMTDGEVVGDGVQIILVLAWLVIFIVMLVKAFKFVNKCSKLDYSFIPVKAEDELEYYYPNEMN